MNPLSNLTTTGADGVSPGLFTSEFLVALATWLIGLTTSFGLHITDPQKAQILVGMPIVYVLGRSLVKAAAAFSKKA